MTRWERAVPAAVTVLVGWACLVLLLVGDRVYTDWRNGKRVAAQSLPPRTGSRLSTERPVDSRQRLDGPNRTTRTSERNG